MPSSTSSSDPVVASSELGTRQVALRAVVAGVALLTAGLLFTRCQTYVLDWVLLEDTRLREAVGLLPEVAETPGPAALFFGSSLVYVGFSPAVFDARLEEHGVDLRSYNFGFGGINPSIQRVLARRVRLAFEEQNRTLALTLVEFTPFQATEARARSNARSREQSLMMLATPTDILHLSLESPERAARTFVVRYLRMGLTAEAMTQVFGGLATTLLSAVLPSGAAALELPPEEVQAQREVQQAGLGLLVGLAKVYGGKPDPWDPEFRGELRLIFPETREHVLRLMQQTPSAFQSDLENRIRCCDIVDLGFDDALIDDFIATVRELAAISERVEVILMPKNAAWVKNPPEALARQSEVLDRIQRETGVPIADFQTLPGFDGSRFRDSTHLTSHEGKPEFSRLLADHYAPALRAPPRSVYQDPMYPRRPTGP